jgi:hypothetical protein
MLPFILLLNVALAVADNGLQVLVWDDPPFICTDQAPCKPSFAGAEWGENSTLKTLESWKTRAEDSHQGKLIFSSFSSYSSIIRPAIEFL